MDTDRTKEIAQEILEPNMQNYEKARKEAEEGYLACIRANLRY